MSTQPVGGFGFEKPGEGKTNDWLTPPEVVKRLGHFDLDPCGCVGMPWDLADRSYELPEHDGLREPWEGRVFCNPPYGPHIAQWAKRMADHGNGVFLIFNRSETTAWQLYIWPYCDAVLFPFGRMCFYMPDGKRAKSGTAPSALIAYGHDNVTALRESRIAGHLVTNIATIAGDKVSSF